MRDAISRMEDRRFKILGGGGEQSCRIQEGREFGGSIDHPWKSLLQDEAEKWGGGW